MKLAPKLAAASALLAAAQFSTAAFALDTAAAEIRTVTGELKAGASRAVSDARALGDKLASGAARGRDEVENGFKSLGGAIDALGQKIGSSKKTSPFDVGA